MRVRVCDERRMKGEGEKERGRREGQRLIGRRKRGREEEESKIKRK